MILLPLQEAEIILFTECTVTELRNIMYFLNSSSSSKLFHYDFSYERENKSKTSKANEINENSNAKIIISSFKTERSDISEYYKCMICE